MTIQLANRSIVQPLGVLEDVLVQVNELIFPADFYVLDMEDETIGKESTLILGRPFLMTARTKIDVYSGTLSMEFGDTLVQFNIFEAMKHPTEDHSLFGIDLIEELVEEYLQLDSCSGSMEDFAEVTDIISCLGIYEEADSKEVHTLSSSEDEYDDIADLEFKAELFKTMNQACNQTNPECSESEEAEVAETNQYLFAQLATIFSAEAESAREGRVKEDVKVNSAKESKIKADKLAETVSAKEDLTQTVAKINGPSESDSEGALEANADSILTRTEFTKSSQPNTPKAKIMLANLQQRRLNPTLLDVVKKEVTKLLAVGIIYPISDSQWVSPVQVVPKKSGMTVMKNQQDELVPTRIQNSWRVCIDYRRLNQATHKDHFPLPFIDQMLEKLSGKSHY
ncbi:Retrovirus-related Pol polyprotein, partial [Mucuna pruriens]